MTHTIMPSSRSPGDDQLPYIPVHLNCTTPSKAKVTRGYGHGWKSSFPISTSPSTRVPDSATRPPSLNPSEILRKAPFSSRTPEPTAGPNNAHANPRATATSVSPTLPVTVASEDSSPPTRQYHPLGNSYNEADFKLADEGEDLDPADLSALHLKSQKSHGCISRSTPYRLAIPPPHGPQCQGNLPSPLRRHTEVQDLTADDIQDQSDCGPADLGDGRNVYIPDLPLTLDDTYLKKLGQQFGRVVSIKVEHNGWVGQDTMDMLPNGAGACRTYAFVMFDSSLAASRFMQHLRDRGMTCQFGKETASLRQKALEDPHSSNLYVAEVPLDATQEDMQRLFYPGIISSLRFLTDAMGNRRGTAMVRLQSRAQAEEAISRLDRKVAMRGGSKTLQVRIADSENQKQLKKTSLELSMDTSEDSYYRVPPSPYSTRPPVSRDYLNTEALLAHVALGAKAEAELRRREALAETVGLLPPFPVGSRRSPASSAVFSQETPTSRPSSSSFENGRAFAYNLPPSRKTAYYSDQTSRPHWDQAGRLRRAVQDTYSPPSSSSSKDSPSSMEEGTFWIDTSSVSYRNGHL